MVGGEDEGTCRNSGSKWKSWQAWLMGWICCEEKAWMTPGFWFEDVENGVSTTRLLVRLASHPTSPSSTSSPSVLCQSPSFL